MAGILFGTPGAWAWQSTEEKSREVTLRFYAVVIHPPPPASLSSLRASQRGLMGLRLGSLRLSAEEPTPEGLARDSPREHEIDSPASEPDLQEFEPI